MEPLVFSFVMNELVTVETMSVEEGSSPHKVVQLGVIRDLTDKYVIVAVYIPGYRRIHVVRYHVGDIPSQHVGDIPPQFEGIEHAHCPPESAS